MPQRMSERGHLTNLKTLYTRSIVFSTQTSMSVSDLTYSKTETCLSPSTPWSRISGWHCFTAPFQVTTLRCACIATSTNVNRRGGNPHSVSTIISPAHQRHLPKSYNTPIHQRQLQIRRTDTPYVDEVPPVKKGRGRFNNVCFSWVKSAMLMKPEERWTNSIGTSFCITVYKLKGGEINAQFNMYLT